MDSGTIAGMNGLIIGVGKLRGLQGTCLLVETSGYVVDAKASKTILESLLSILGLTVNMNNLEKKARDTGGINPNNTTAGRRESIGESTTPRCST